MIYKLEEFFKTLEKSDSYRLFKYTDEAYKTEKCYHQVVLPKKDGGVRILQVPNKKLKRLQRNLLQYFQHAEISSCAAAYVKGRTIKEQAMQHVNSKLVVKLDIENFFGSITYQKVFDSVDEALNRSPLIGPYHKMNAQPNLKLRKYNSELSWFVAKACTLNGSLPQGAPTSPMLSNMVFLPLDKAICYYCKDHGINYTRYSDDMIFSGDFHPFELISFIRKLLLRNGYILNENKIVVAGRGKQQKITGVVVNQKPQADRKYRREIRQDIYYIGKYGLEEHLLKKGVLIKEDQIAEHMVKELQKLIGRIAFVLQIDPDNIEFQAYKSISINLLNRVPLFWNTSSDGYLL